ncbi:MAG: hypothetical protein J6R08_06395 [Opitutales bacterium]|nr:hypothetical protein [Opitutales bacterium]
MKPKLSTNLILRINEDLKSKLVKIQAESGCSTSELVRQCLLSIAEYYDKNNCLILPVVAIPKKDLETLKKSKSKV